MPRKKVELSEALEGFYRMYQTKEINELIKAIPHPVPPTGINLMGTAKFQQGDITITIRGYNAFCRKPTATTAQFFDCLMLQYTKDKDPLVKLPIAEYMSMRKIKDSKEAVLQAKTASAHLRAVSYEFKNKKGSLLQIDLAGGTRFFDVEKGVIWFRLNPDFIASIDHSQYMEYPVILLQLNTNNNPWSFYLGRKLTEYKRINITDGKNGGNSISVKSLLEACPNFPDPSKTRHITREIIKPFERDMNALKEMLSWKYRDGKPKDHQEFMRAMIDVTWHNYPEISIKSSKAKVTRNDGAENA